MHLSGKIAMKSENLSLSPVFRGNLQIMGILAAFFSLGIELSAQKGRNELPEWTVEEIEAIHLAVTALQGIFPRATSLHQALGGVRIVKQRMSYGGTARAHRITVNAHGFSVWTVVHELAHAWDAVHKWRFSARMKEELGAGFRHPLWRRLEPENPLWWYNVGQGPPPCGVDANFNAKEDFAESVTALVYPEEARRLAAARGWPYEDARRGYDYGAFAETPRGRFVAGLISSMGK